MKILAKTGTSDLATVYVAESSEGKKLEFVESIQPPFEMKDKWVSIISTLYGCPVGCPICDAGRDYCGKVNKKDLLNQIDYLVDSRFENRNVTSKQWKIQFARMGDPVLNPDVLDVLRELPSRYNAPGLMPSISTVAPRGCLKFLNELIQIRDELYSEKFQMQFSVHTTDFVAREKLVPVKTLSFSEMAVWGEKFYRDGTRKVTLNFALGTDSVVDAKVLSDYFNPEVFVIKLTPVNPTFSAKENKIKTLFKDENEVSKLANQLKLYDFDVIVSVGELEENAIGSNCGQYVTMLNDEINKSDEMYTYPLDDDVQK